MFLHLIAILLLINLPAQDPGEQVNHFFKNALKEYDDFKVEMLNNHKNIVSINFLQKTVPENRGLVSLPAELTLSDGAKIRSVLSFRLQVFKKVFMASASIEKKTVLNPALFSRELVDVTNLPGTPVSGINELNNTVAKRKIKPGEILLKEFIENAPVVKAGDKITASVCYGSAVITFDAYSKQDGCMDEVIRVVSQDKKMFKARVIDQYNVAIVQ